jgi:hypothetical protein
VISQCVIRTRKECRAGRVEAICGVASMGRGLCKPYLQGDKPLFLEAGFVQLYQRVQGMIHRRGHGELGAEFGYVAV